MKINRQILLILILWIVNSSLSFGQIKNSSKVLISKENLIVTRNNLIRIVAQQEKPVSIHQVKATFQESGKEKEPFEISEKNGYFLLTPRTIGIIELHITIGDTIETRKLIVKPMGAVGRLGAYKANTDKKISLGEFKAQMGIVARIECCDIDGKYKVLGFEVIRISNKNVVERCINKGGGFGEKTRNIIKKAQSNDTFIFRKIKYKCPYLEKPQRLDDMIFEIE
ncbi:MAG: GldM family protein [Chitinophagales bacterium]